MILKEVLSGITIYDQRTVKTNACEISIGFSSSKDYGTINFKSDVLPETITNAEVKPFVQAVMKKIGHKQNPRIGCVVLR